ncbi:CDP-diacylglycerol--glycerol-3-phosphate 3-phosphatidyltransferase [Pseudoclavibacter sp. 13-3]|uniref:CDP-diacylglycerol--glycerol-3-phosphate 3-phosphatidyltransferase n=1 Tax=Pseudoclavibacter sp. 13-3 TaxID=2901228 RepID=UPI001E5DA251|nr:CDP-diacylglycerol--glycerol-3-phosphate 3-phosphatidyltransferase [Pseudoclavibacter sp. 13-3]MCD7100978.1 CDP-diacylglycerol--glycerol-3-phosphate 3-phosphatidyltransferase [Pseudoclavibacter sp. 13-3]
MTTPTPARSSDAQPSPWNLPNTITVVRILFAPAVFALLLVDAAGPHGGSLRWWATALFVVAMASDGVDGHLARSRGQVTDFGKIADPIADKGMTGLALIGLSIVGDVWWAVTIVILVREIGITVYRIIALRSHLVIPASRAGKLKTVVQSVAIACALAPFALHVVWFQWVTWVLLAAAVLLTLYSGIAYVVDAVRGHRSRSAVDDSSQSGGTR